MTTHAHNEHSSPNQEPGWLEVVRDSIGAMRFGMVQIVVHEGRVMQVDATHRTRIETGTPAVTRK